MWWVENNYKIHKCNDCPLRSECGYPLGSLQIGQNPKIMIVIDQPTFEEDLTQMQFDDRHNRYLKGLLHEHLNSWYLTYAVKCYNDPKVKDRKCVEIWLEKEVQQIQPKIILTMGKLSFEYVVKPHIKNGTKTFKKNLTRNIQRPDGIITMPWYSSQYLFNRGKDVKEYFCILLKFLNHCTINENGEMKYEMAKEFV